MDMKALLQELADSKLVRVTGSYADGTFSESSDIDFKIKESKTDIYGKDVLPRPIDKVRKICEKHGISFGSSTVGALHTHNISGNGYLPIAIEFYEYFHHRPNRKKEVDILGVTFQTW